MCVGYVQMQAILHHGLEYPWNWATKAGPGTYALWMPRDDQNRVLQASRRVGNLICWTAPCTTSSAHPFSPAVAGATRRRCWQCLCGHPHGFLCFCLWVALDIQEATQPSGAYPPWEVRGS